MKKIEIGGASRPVLYNINALASFNQGTGTTLDWIFKMMSNPLNMDMNHLRWLAYVGLKEGAEEEGVAVDFDLRSVGKWLTNDFVKWQEFMLALGEGLPKADPSKKK